LKAKREWMSTGEVAAKIGYTERTVLRLGDAGVLRYRSLSEHGWRRHSSESVEAFLRKQQRNGHGGKKK
jgi:hypothetical protein